MLQSTTLQSADVSEGQHALPLQREGQLPEALDHHLNHATAAGALKGEGCVWLFGGKGGLGVGVGGQTDGQHTSTCGPVYQSEH